MNLLEPNPPMQLCKTNPRFEKTAPPFDLFARDIFFHLTQAARVINKQPLPGQISCVRGSQSFFPFVVAWFGGRLECQNTPVGWLFRGFQNSSDWRILEDYEVNRSKTFFCHVCLN